MLSSFISGSASPTLSVPQLPSTQRQDEERTLDITVRGLATRCHHDGRGEISRPDDVTNLSPCAPERIVVACSLRDKDLVSPKPSPFRAHHHRNSRPARKSYAYVTRRSLTLGLYARRPAEKRWFGVNMLLIGIKSRRSYERPPARSLTGTANRKDSEWQRESNKREHPPFCQHLHRAECWSISVQFRVFQP
ncbi:Dvir\GJ16097-PA-like protein [Anopheles sinensis]|uniref:Dvir\GJ16097-PA-like protein n=1 Tax=Anopheles sinensis TaxID=74873 RepID=A0A084VFE3_ANOSI|nr:Dvir\GJ16097-PA-like protein [Anopheles sinensis]